MDRTPEYIKMSEKAEKLQKEFQKEDDFSWVQQGYCTKHNSFIGHWYEGEVKCIEEPECSIYASEKESQEKHCHSEKDWIVLFRQDQLQEMTHRRRANWVPLEAFYHNAIYPDDTWEKFWLAFVMYREYEKTWDGETWK